MADKRDELEPLFEYKRVQPCNTVCLEDDDIDSSPVMYPKRIKLFNKSKPVKEVDSDDDDVLIIGSDTDASDEEDWLPPPPKVSDDFENQLGEDSTIKALRLQKQELESLAKSGDMLQAVEDSVKRKLGCSDSANAASENTAEQPEKPLVERAKIIVSFQDKKETYKFRVYKDDKFERVFKLYIDKVKLNIQSLVFCFDGDKISPTETPDSLGMEDDDIIEVRAKKS